MSRTIHPLFMVDLFWNVQRRMASSAMPINHVKFYVVTIAWAWLIMILHDIWIGEVWRSICLACVSMNLWSNLWFTIIIDIPYSLVYEISTMNIVCSVLWYLVTFLMTLSIDKITNIIIPTYFSSSKYQLLKQVWHTLHLKIFVMECCCGWL